MQPGLVVVADNDLQQGQTWTHTSRAPGIPDRNIHSSLSETKQFLA